MSDWKGDFAPGVRRAVGQYHTYFALWVLLLVLAVVRRLSTQETRGVSPAATTRKKAASSKTREPPASPPRRSPKRRIGVESPPRGRNLEADKADSLSKRRCSPDSGAPLSEEGEEGEERQSRYFAEVVHVPVPAFGVACLGFQRNFCRLQAFMRAQLFSPKQSLVSHV